MIKTTLEKQKDELEKVMKSTQDKLEKLREDLKKERVQKFLGKNKEVFLRRKDDGKLVWIKILNGDVLGLSVSERGFEKWPVSEGSMISFMNDERMEKIKREVFVDFSNRFLVPFKLF